MSDTYFETLGATVDAVARLAEESRAVVSRPSEIGALCQDHLAYGAVRTGDFQLDTYKGKPTRKYFHATITRLDSGRYELVTYVL